MLNFIIKRILHGITVLFGVVIIIFLLFNVMPDPARMMLGQRADLASVDAINSDLGRNQSITKRFLLYLNDLSPISINNYKTEASPIFINEQKYGNYLSLITLSTEKKIVLKSPYLRRSYQSKKNVSEILMDALPGTAVLAFSAMLFATIIGILLGIIAAIKKNTLYDRLALILSEIGRAS